MTLAEINNALTTLDPAWAISYVPWGDAIICHLTVNGITRSHVGTLGNSEAERHEDATRNAARMFGIGREVQP